MKKKEQEDLKYFYEMIDEKMAEAYSSNQIIIDENLALDIVSRNGFFLAKCIPKIQDNEKIVMAAVLNEAGAFEWASKRLQSSKDFVIRLTKENPFSIAGTTYALPFIDDPEIKKALGKDYETIKELCIMCEKVDNSDYPIIEVLEDDIDYMEERTNNEEGLSGKDFVLKVLQNLVDGAYDSKDD